MHHPSGHRRTSHFKSCISLENRALAIERERVAILRNDCVDDDLVRDQRLIEDAIGDRSNHHTLFLTALAGTLLALDHTHEVGGWLDVEHFALFIADDGSLFAAAAAEPPIGRAGNDLLDASKMRGQRLPTRMLALMLPHFAVRFRLA